ARYHRVDRQPRLGADRPHAAPHADLATRSPDRRRGGSLMGATQNPQQAQKTAERLGAAPKRAAPQRRSDEPSFQELFHAWLESHRASLVDSLRRLARQPVGSFFTCLVIAIALALPMGLALLLNNLERLGGSWQSAAQISVYLKLDASDADGERLREEI